MLAMTIGTARRAGSAQRMTHTVDAGGILFRRLIMAGSAVDRLGRHIVIRVFAGYVGMTTRARVRAMHRRSELGFIDKKPNRFACRIGLVQSFIRMALQTSGVGVLFSSKGTAAARKEDGNQKWSQRGNPKSQIGRASTKLEGTAEYPARRSRNQIQSDSRKWRQLVTTDFADHTDWDLFRGIYPCNRCNPWLRSERRRVSGKSSQKCAISRCSGTEYTERENVNIWNSAYFAYSAVQ